MAINKEKFRSFLSPKKEEINPTPIISVTEEVEFNTIVKLPELEETIETKLSIKELVKEEPKTLNEKEEFEALDLSKNDLLELKKIAFSNLLQEDISISELVDLVLLSKTNKSIKQKNKDALVIREYVDMNGKITTKGKVYLEEESTKNRLKEILQ